LSPAAHRALDALLAATPDPPSDAEPDDVVIAAAAMVDARAPHVETLRADTAAPCADCTPLAGRLAERDARWEGALQQARHQLSERLAAARRRSPR